MGWLFLLILIARIWMAYGGKQGSNSRPRQAQLAVSGPCCARCGTPYDPEDYGTDATHIYCSQCKAELPGRALSPPSDDPKLHAFTTHYYLSPTPERLPEILERSLKFPWFNDTNNSVAW